MKRGVLCAGAAVVVTGAVICGCVSIIGEETSENKVVYLEEFDHYADHVACFNPGTKVWEWQTGSLKGLFFAPEEDGLARDGFFPISPSPKGKWTLTFNLWNRTKTKEPSPITLVLYFGDRKNPTAVEYPFVATKNWWQLCHVFSENRGELVGWNVKGAKGVDVIIDRVRVEQGVHRPYRLGDPVEWLAKLPPVIDETLPADFGTALADGKAVPVDLEKNDLLFKFKPSGKDRLFFVTGDKAGRALDFNLDNEICYDPDGKKLTLTNECLTVSPARAPWFPRIYTRPRMDSRYQKPEQEQILAALDRFPKPENKVFDLRLTRNERGENEVWINGNFAMFFTNAPIATVTGTPAFRMKTEPRPKDSLVQPLDFRAWPDGFPLWMVRENRGGCWLGVLDYSCRSCFEAMPSSCMFSVPNRPYVRAKALCRVATDVPADFEPVVVARLTSYLKNSWGDEGGRTADACAKVEVRLPRPGSNDPLAKGVVKKGENLYEVTFDLPVGDMQDLLYREDSLVDRNKPTHPKIDQLDFEFTGVLWRQDAFYVDRRSVPDSEVQSSVVVLSGELEAAPCDFDVVPLQTFNVYLPGETVGGTYFIKPRVPGKYAIEWTVSDESGKVVDKGVIENRSRSKVEVDSGVIKFKVHEVGYYKVRYAFKGNGHELWHHDATFIIAPKNDRQADYDSPYFSWLWSGTHGTCNDLEANLDALRRTGVKKTMLQGYASIAEGDPLARKYGLYNGQFPYRSPRPRGNETFDQMVERMAQENRELVKKYPHTKRALVFHESYRGPFPMELVGGKTELTDADIAKDWLVYSNALATAKAWRLADPSVKLVMGNSVESYGLLARVFRHGFPKDLVDFVGEETVGQSLPPEEVTARVPWMQQEIARIFGYDVKSDCPFEWKARSPRNFTEPVYTPCAFHVRDLLIAHALGYTLIPSGGVAGRGNDGYAQSVWSGAANGRWPLAYPGRGILASAVLTSVLDCAKFKRLVPTGSLGVYCEEFEVKGKWVYALWTTRGETDVTLDLGANADYETASALGKRTVGVKNRNLVVSDEPRYLVCAKPLGGAKTALQRRYPQEEMSFAKQTVVVPLLTTDEAEIFDVFDRRFFRKDNPFLRRGRFELRTAEDPVRGSCVEIRDLLGTKETLKTQENCTTINFQRSQPVAGEYDTIGIWVEGNMGCGRVWFEFTDAEGEVWATTGSGGYGCGSYDWGCQMSVNFDGWHFLKFPISASSPVKIPAVGADFWQLTRDGHGNGKIDYPIKVTGMAFSNRPWNLDFLEMRPTRPYVRIKDVTLLKAN